MAVIFPTGVILHGTLPLIIIVSGKIVAILGAITIYAIDLGVSAVGGMVGPPF